MLDLGWTELLLIGIVALIVVGPKDLPVMFRTLGKFTARLRAMARDFTRAMEDAADEAGVKDIAKDLKKATDPKSMGMDALKDAADLDFDPFGEDDEVADEAATKPARGPETQKLTEERAEAARKIRESAAAKATARLEAEAAARAEAEAAQAAAKAPEADTPKA
ncbi:Sec-independent protein translocase protein TatB [Aliiruegeria sabulilitoris]|uniref:Sec-independent protein translocase protein TatB n=1 Tax=Aliiruegeria sabulilitoris TaxID=1510458 RepID=UPI00082EA526|nr:Sec-independent protein translocase protein TatB [Aliiruegeria sabulilitoris]NDR54975.1 twin-arginine translocase subunit TatB [Pseudoruegeria sp. M32A2M]